MLLEALCVERNMFFSTKQKCYIFRYSV